MTAFNILYTLLGGLGLFFYGMKAMSDSLQAVAGDLIKKIINSLTSNRFFAVTVGLLVTMIVQSSSVTTVMVVGFVNAGLMGLTQAIGVIFGSNIGTTITGWIISVKIGKYGLLLVGLGIFPALFAKSDKWKHLGRILFGIGLIFTGLETMTDAFKPLRDNEGFLSAISYFSGNNYQSFIASTIIGCLLTIIVQSSSAMLGITIALAMTGVISFQTSVALVLGENIGTTITAILASVGANVNAKRAARAHALFNIFGVLLIYTILPKYMQFIDWIVPGEANLVQANGDRPNIASHIAMAHTMFNVSATLFFLPWINQLARLVTHLTPDKKQKEVPHLVMLGNPADVLPATAIIQAHQELKKCKDILERLSQKTRTYISDPTADAKLLAKINEYEQITDNIQKEMTVFLCLVMERPLSHQQSLETQAMVRIADEFESIADYFARMASYKIRFEKDFDMNSDAGREFLEFYDEVWRFFDTCTQGLYDIELHDLSLCQRKSEKLRIWADDMRDKHVDRISKGLYQPVSALTYSDMVVSLRKIRAHAINVAQAVENFREKEEI
jgi:phosphate:Na+ symporter